MSGLHLSGTPLRRWRRFFPTFLSLRSPTCGNWRLQELSRRVYANISRPKCSAARVPAEVQLVALPPKILARPIGSRHPLYQAQNLLVTGVPCSASKSRLLGTKQAPPTS